MSNIAFHFFLCALTKFRLLTKTDPRVFFYADMNTHHGLFLFFFLSIKTNLIIIIELFRCSLNKRKALQLD